MPLLWCSSKFAQLYKLSLCINLAYVIKYIFNPSLWNIDNIAPLVVNIYLGLLPREIFLPWVQYLSLFHALGWNIYNIYIYPVVKLLSSFTGIYILDVAAGIK